VSRFTSRRSGGQDEQRWGAPAWPLYTFNGTGYPSGVVPLQSGTKRVDHDGSFAAMVQQVHNTSGPVSAAVVARALLVSQLRFTWYDNATDNVFGNAELDVVNFPQRRGGLTRNRLFFTAEEHVSYAGNAYFRRHADGRLSLLNPQWTSVVIGSDEDELDPTNQGDARVVGYLYRPAGKEDDARILTTDEVVQWAPEPNPWCWWMGGSWITAVLLEVATDRQATEHISKFYENAATPQLIFKFDASVQPEAISAYAEAVNSKHAGAANAYKNLFIGGGADVQAVGASVAQLDYAGTTGGFENRVIMRSRVPAVILGSREGMQGSALNSGNYLATRRMWADGWFSPTSDGLASTLEGLLTLPSNGAPELRPDTSRVLFLQEDRKDQAEIGQLHANSLRSLVDAGYDPASAVQAVATDDLTKLQHSGLYSVQLQPPQPDGPAAVEPARHETHVHIDERAIVAEVPVTIADGAIRSDVTVEAAQVAVSVPERAVTVEAPRVDVAAPVVNVEAAPPAERSQTVRHVERDDKGAIVRIIEETS
jgi:hypothetical protein